MLRAIAALLCLTISTAAFGQAAILQGGPWTPGHTGMYVGQGSTQPILQDSGPAGGGGLGLGISEQLLTVRGTGTAPYANAGTGPLGTNACDYDAPTTNPTGYHFLCFSPNAQGGGLITYGAGGTATPLPLQINVNGTFYPFPFVTGGIIGPSTTVNGDLVCWNNTIGTLVKDCTSTLPSGLTLPNATLTNPTMTTPHFDTATGVFENLIGTNVAAITVSGTQLKVQNSATTADSIWLPFVPAGWFNWDAVQSTIVIPAGSTQVNGSGFSVYMRNQQAGGGNGQNGVGFWGIITAEVDNARIWGSNIVFTDSASPTDPSNGTGVNRQAVGTEYDFNMRNSSVVSGIALELRVLGPALNAAGGFACGDAGDTIQAITPLTVVNGGAGYVTADTVTIAGGTLAGGGNPTVLNVVASAGVITSVTINTAGLYASGAYPVGSPPTVPIGQASTSGVGSGATFYVPYQALGQWNQCFNAQNSTVGMIIGKLGKGGASLPSAPLKFAISGPTGAGSYMQLQAISVGASLHGLRVISDDLANYLTFETAATANAPQIIAQGSDTNVGLGFSSKGTGNITFNTKTVAASSTDATSSATGGFSTAGGVGIAKSLWVGTTANITGLLTLQNHIAATQVTAPALTSCGTSPTDVNATDTAGTVTMGTGTPTGCIITFNRAYTGTPSCNVSSRSQLTSFAYTVSTTAITTTQTATSSNLVDYTCVAPTGG